MIPYFRSVFCERCKQSKQMDGADVPLLYIYEEPGVRLQAARGAEGAVLAYKYTMEFLYGP